MSLFYKRQIIQSSAACVLIRSRHQTSVTPVDVTWNYNHLSSDFCSGRMLTWNNLIHSCSVYFVFWFMVKHCCVWSTQQTVLFFNIPWCSMCRPAWRIRDTVALHAQPPAVRCRHHGAGPRLYSCHGYPSQTTHLLPQRVLHLQVYPDCMYPKTALFMVQMLKSGCSMFEVFLPRAEDLGWCLT